MKVFGRLCTVLLWWFAASVAVGNGFRQIICGAGSVLIGCSGDKGIAIKRLFGCEDCTGDQCSESILDKANIDIVWSRCNLSSSCNIVPEKIKTGQGLGVEYQCAANATGCYDDNISLYCPEGQTIHVTNFYRLTCCQAISDTCQPRETEVPIDGSALTREIVKECQGQQHCRERVPINAMRVHYTCEGGDNKQHIPSLPPPTVTPTEVETIPPPPTTANIVEDASLSSFVIIVIVGCVFGATALVVINIAVAVFCGPKETSYIVTPRKPSSNHIQDDPAKDHTKWKPYVAKAKEKENEKEGMKENDLYEPSDFRGPGYLSLKENDLYQSLDECGGQRSNHIPEGQMKDNVIYQPFKEVRPTSEQVDADFHSGIQLKESYIGIYDGLDYIGRVHGINRLHGYKTMKGKGHKGDLDQDGMKENDLYQPIPHL